MQTNETAKKLAALYETGHDDRPENVLWNYPAAGQVVEALKILIHVMFPGMYPAKEEALDVYLKNSSPKFRACFCPNWSAPFRFAGSRNPPAGRAFRPYRMSPPKPAGF